MKTKGWHYDSFRHSLAAKGVKTRSYQKSKFWESMKDKPSVGQSSLNASLAAEARSECEMKMMDAVKEGTISSRDADRFWVEFDRNEALFMEGSPTYNYQDFKADTLDKCGNYIDRHSGKMSVSGMIEGRNMQ